MLMTEVQQQDTIVFVSSVVPRQFLCVKTEGIIGRDWAQLLLDRVGGGPGPH